MYGALLKESAGIVGRRFFLDALLPCFAVGAIAVVIVGSDRAGGLGKAVREWTAQDVEMKTVQIVAFFAAVALLAVLLNSMLIVLVRFFEGYWPQPLANLGKGLHQARLRRLADQEALYFRYPPKSRPEEVMPTRLGNVLKSAELYPALRYGMDGVLFWPRLYVVLPDRVAAMLAEARSALERLLTLSWLVGVFAIITGTYLLVARGSWVLYLASLVGGTLLALVCYRAALRVANEYAEQVRAVFDVYRRDLTEKLEGEDSTLDRPQWMALGRFWYQGIPREAQIEPDKADKPILTAPKRTASVWVPTLSTWYAALVLLVGAAGAYWLANRP